MELPRLFGPYELVRRLASGAMVDVYLAQARSVAGFQKAVAIKMIRVSQSDEDPDFVSQLVEEANIASRLSHKNVVQVIDLGEIEHQHYIAMEYVDGVDLAKLLSRLGPRRGAVSPRVAAYIMREVCEGLDHAHRKTDNAGKALRIVHRDVTPSNILISFVGEVKLTDFGLAKASLRAAATQAGQIKGKYSYMAPEQAKGHAVDARTDVFAAGLVLYELVTGRQAYPDAPLPLMLERITRAIFEPAEKLRPELPAALADIVRRSMAADPSQRHPSARALADDLTVFLYTQDPQPEGELAQLLERVSDSARSHLAPLGAPLVDDESNDVTNLEAQRAVKSVATMLTPAVAPRKPPPSVPAAPRSVPPPPPNVARTRHAPGGRPVPPPAADPHPSGAGVRPALKPTQTPPPMPAATGHDDSELLSRKTPSVLRAPSLPGPTRPSARRQALIADENPTEVMADAGPDAELLATATAASLAQRAAAAANAHAAAANAHALASPAPTAPPAPAASAAPLAAPTAPVVVPEAPTHFGAPSPESLRPPRAPQELVAPEADTLVKAPPLRARPDVTAPHQSLPPAKPRPSQAPIVIAVAIGVIVGLGGALLLLLLRR
jgi:eukaryotic-like serine/threonine-protein kinase